MANTNNNQRTGNRDDDGTKNSGKSNKAGSKQGDKGGTGDEKRGTVTR
jgi:hypothetical protein